MSSDESLLRRMLARLRERTRPETEQRSEELARRWRTLSHELDPRRTPLILRNPYDVESDEDSE
jgi:hypothetical protein